MTRWYNGFGSLHPISLLAKSLPTFEAEMKTLAAEVGGPVGFIGPFGTLRQLEHAAIVTGKGSRGEIRLITMSASPIPPLRWPCRTPAAHPACLHRTGYNCCSWGCPGSAPDWPDASLEQSLGKDGFKLAGGALQCGSLPILALAQLTQAIQVLDILHHAHVHAVCWCQTLPFCLPHCRPWQPLAACYSMTS